MREDLLIRRERPEDGLPAGGLIDAAFGPPGGAAHAAETVLLDGLRADGDVVAELTFAAVLDGRLAGHVVCSRARLGEGRAVALGPIAVRPDLQRQGVGSALVAAVVATAERAGRADAWCCSATPAYYAALRVRDRRPRSGRRLAWARGRTRCFQVRTLPGLAPGARRAVPVRPGVRAAGRPGLRPGRRGPKAGPPGRSPFHGRPAAPADRFGGARARAGTLEHCVWLGPDARSRDHRREAAPRPRPPLAGRPTHRSSRGGSVMGSAGRSSRCDTPERGGRSSGHDKELDRPAPARRAPDQTYGAQVAYDPAAGPQGPAGQGR